MAIELASDEAKLLAEIGFLGVGRGLAGPSEVVFAALDRFRPGQEAAPIGLALAALSRGAIDRAVAVLRAAPQTETVIAFRVLAHARHGDRALAHELLDDLRAGGAERALIEMAEDAVAQI